jgi:hypothetical protein
MKKLIAALFQMSPCQEKGLAAKYPGDAGIERDPDVIFVESFGNDSWRKTDEPVINNLVLSTNTSTPPEAGRKRTVWIDGIVLAKRYIGPMAAKGK